MRAMKNTITSGSIFGFGQIAVVVVRRALAVCHLFLGRARHAGKAWRRWSTPAVARAGG